MSWWYGFFVVALYGLVSLIVRNLDATFRKLYHPWVIVGGLNILYTLTPLSSPVIRSEQPAALETFLLLQLLGIVGLAVGTLSAYALWQEHSHSHARVTAHIGNLLGLRAAMAVFFVLWLAAFQVYEGGIVNVFFSGYHWGVETSGGDVILYAVATYPLLALIVAGYFAKGASLEVIVAGGAFAVLNLLGGHRNLVMMELGGLLAIHSLRGQRPSYTKMFFAGVGGFFFLMFIGIYRGLGAQGLPIILAVLKQDGLRVFDPSTQELGTSFNVFRIYLESRGAGFENWLPGESYVRAFLSTIPRQLWPDRPLAIASHFSNLYANTGEGLGFSFNLEAYINFGALGVFLAMAVLGFIVTSVYIRHCTRRVTMFGISFYATTLFVSFNLNRIDFQTVLKIGALLAGSQYIVLRVFAKERSPARTSRAVGMIADPSGATVIK